MIYRVGDKAFLVESNREVRAGKILRVKNGMYLFGFFDGGGIQVRESRLFPSRQAAEASIPKRTMPKPMERRSVSPTGNHFVTIKA